jgi:mRNA-degrading endonuclease RelE of RelBE toxin-antitoxin system
MAYQPITTYYFEKRFKKLTKKDGLLKERIIRKLLEIINNPDIGEPKRHALRGLRSVHIDPFVVAFVVIKDTILLINLDHHDKVHEETPKIIDALMDDPRTIEALTNAGVTPEEYAAFMKSFRKKK